jgi:branched-chain amino acid transport system permease protein
VFVVLLAVAPLFITSSYFVTVIINAMIFTVLAMSLNVIYGYTGLLSFAQVGFWGLGGYTAALTATRLGLGPWVGLLIGAGLCAAVAAALGAVALRLSNHAFVIVSIAFTLLMQLLSQQWIDVTNGPMGIPGLPTLTVGFGESAFALDTPRAYYCAVFVFYVCTLAIMRLVLGSRIGMTLKLIKFDETLARSYGVRVTRWKLFAAAFAAAFAALAGAMQVFFLTIVDPSIFDVYYTQIMLVIVIVGGLGSFWPVIWAGFALTILPELLRTPNEIRMIEYGVVLIVAVVLFPGGVAAVIERWASGRKPAPRAVRLERPVSEAPHE